MTNYKCLHDDEYLLIANLKKCNLYRNNDLSNHISTYYINLNDLYLYHSLSVKEKIGTYLCTESQKDTDKYIFYTDIEYKDLSTLGQKDLFELEKIAINNVHEHKKIADVEKIRKSSNNNTNYRKLSKEIKGKSTPLYQGIFFMANKVR